MTNDIILPKGLIERELYQMYYTPFKPVNCANTFQVQLFFSHEKTPELFMLSIFYFSSILLAGYVYFKFNVWDKTKFVKKKGQEKMKKILFLAVLMVILIGFVIWTPSVNLEEVDVNGNDEGVTDFESEEMESFFVEDSDFFMKNHDQSNNLFTKEFHDNYNILCQNSMKKYNDLMTTVDAYVQRYVSLFLITSNLKEYEIKDSDEMITIDLEISISKEDLAYLQSFSKNTEDSSHSKNFSKLNVIFSKIAKLKEKSYAENIMSSFKFSFPSFNVFSILNSPGFYHFFPFGVIFLATWIIYHSFYHKSFYTFIGIIINSLIIWESLHLYWKKVKEVDIEIYVKALHLKNSPKECDPAELSWYDSVLNLFREDKCLQYFKNLNKNPIEEVFLFQCIIDTYSYYFIQTPFRILGASIKDFTGEISAIWPWQIRWLISIPLIPFLTVVVLFFVLILCGKRLKMSFFNIFNVEIGNVKSITTNGNTVLNNQIPKAIRVIRKLKPWTKSRFPKRSEIDLVKQRKRHLKGSKSVSEMVVSLNKPSSCNDIEVKNE